jgi:hypothetical protein
VATASFVAVGKESTGPMPQMNLLAFIGERNVSIMISPSPVLRSPFARGTL